MRLLSLSLPPHTRAHTPKHTDIYTDIQVCTCHLEIPAWCGGKTVRLGGWLQCSLRHRQLYNALEYVISPLKPLLG